MDFFLKVIPTLDSSNPKVNIRIYIYYIHICIAFFWTTKQTPWALWWGEGVIFMDEFVEILNTPTMSPERNWNFWGRGKSNWKMFHLGETKNGWEVYAIFSNLLGCGSILKSDLRPSTWISALRNPYYFLWWVVSERPATFWIGNEENGLWRKIHFLQTFAAFFSLIRSIFFWLRPNKICVFFRFVSGDFDFFKQILWVPRRVGQIASRPSPNGGSGSGKCSKPGTFRFFGITLENLPNGIRSFDDRNIKNGTCWLHIFSQDVE